MILDVNLLHILDTRCSIWNLVLPLSQIKNPTFLSGTPKIGVPFLKIGHRVIYETKTLIIEGSLGHPKYFLKYLIFTFDWRRSILFPLYHQRCMLEVVDEYFFYIRGLSNTWQKL